MSLYLKIILVIIFAPLAIYICIELIREIIIFFIPKLAEHKLNKTWIAFDRKSYETIKKIIETKTIYSIVNSFYGILTFLIMILMCSQIFVFTFPFIFIYQIFQLCSLCFGKKYKKEEVAFVFYFNFLKNFCTGKYL